MGFEGSFKRGKGGGGFNVGWKRVPQGGGSNRERPVTPGPALGLGDL